MEGTASAVTHKQLRRKSDGRSFTMYTVETDRGSFSTSRRDIAADANRLLEQPARFLVKTEQRGEFLNYYLEAVEPANGAPHTYSGSFPQEMPRPKQPQQQQQQQPQQQPRQERQEYQQQELVGTPAGPTEKDVFIFRQTAAKVTAQISRTPEEFWENIDAITAYFTDGSKPPMFSNTNSGTDDADDIPF